MDEKEFAKEIDRGPCRSRGENEDRVITKLCLDLHIQQVTSASHSLLHRVEGRL